MLTDGWGAGGRIVIACWCQREETAERPLTASDKSKLKFLYDEWAHPFFVSYQQFARLLQVRRWLASALCFFGATHCLLRFLSSCMCRLAEDNL